MLHPDAPKHMCHWYLCEFHVSNFTISLPIFPTYHPHSCFWMFLDESIQFKVLYHSPPKNMAKTGKDMLFRNHSCPMKWIHNTAQSIWPEICNWRFLALDLAAVAIKTGRGEPSLTSDGSQQLAKCRLEPFPSSAYTTSCVEATGGAFCGGSGGSPKFCHGLHRSCPKRTLADY